MADPVTIAVAAVKIALSVVEQYGKAAHGVALYRRYYKEIKTIVRIINVRQNIFRLAIRALLMPCVEEDEAEQMLNDPNHASWEDLTVKTYIGNRVSRASDAFEDAIALVTSNLHALEAIGKSCGFLLKDAHPKIDQPVPSEFQLGATSKDSKAHRSIKRKITLLFDEAQIDHLLSKLRDNTEAFRTLVEQTEPEARTHVSRPTLATKQKLKVFTTIKDAAGNLYEALGLACTVHTEHRAHLNLQIAHTNTRQVKFTIAFTQVGVKAPASGRALGRVSDPVWLTVESAITGTIDSPKEHQQCAPGIGVVNALQVLQKRPRESPSPPPEPAPRSKLKKKQPNKVAFAPEIEISLPPSLPSVPIDSLPNFCSNSNFCNQLQKLLSQKIPNCDQPVGYLHCPGDVKHLVYIRSKAQSISASPSSTTLISLRKLFAQAHQNAQSESVLQQHQRVALAKQLATAVLQFQATPWLDKSWDSDNVLISGQPPSPSDENFRLGTLHESYVNVSIKSPLNPVSRSNTLPNRTLIRNGLLFRLGVMLLELAFQQPLSQLRKPSDVDANDELNTEYFTADRIQRHVSTYLGPRYAELVRKCIKCDFGHGEDLGMLRLQEGFYQDVISELDDVERSFRILRLEI